MLLPNVILSGATALSGAAAQSKDPYDQHANTTRSAFRDRKFESGLQPLRTLNSPYVHITFSMHTLIDALTTHPPVASQLPF